MIRELPRIDIAGESYFIDLRLNEFRHVDDFMNRIDIDRDLWEKETGFLLAYDTKNKCVFRGTKEQFDQRSGKDVVEVQLPGLKEMDPVGFEHMVEQWKESNPLLCAMIEAIPQVLDEKPESTAPQKVHSKAEKRKLLPQKRKYSLLPKKRYKKSKGKKL